MTYANISKHETIRGKAEDTFIVRPH